MNIGIVILAAGMSSRMGTPKQLLPLNDTTLLGFAIENAIQSNANDVFCVLGAHAEKIQDSIQNYNIKIINNPYYKGGMSTSIVQAINNITHRTFDAVIIMLADQPKVDASYLNLLIDSYRKHSSRISASEYSGHLGVPALFPKAFFEQLLKLKGDKGAKAFLNSKKKDIIRIKNNHLDDIDTNEDYLNFLSSK